MVVYGCGGPGLGGACAQQHSSSSTGDIAPAAGSSPKHAAHQHRGPATSTTCTASTAAAATAAAAAAAAARQLRSEGRSSSGREAAGGALTCNLLPPPAELPLGACAQALVAAAAHGGADNERRTPLERGAAAQRAMCCEADSQQQLVLGLWPGEAACGAGDGPVEAALHSSGGASSGGGGCVDVVEAALASPRSMSRLLPTPRRQSRSQRLQHKQRRQQGLSQQQQGLQHWLFLSMHDQRSQQGRLLATIPSSES
jgi:hypothetical protein